MFSQRDASRFEREVMNNNPFPEFSNVTPSLGRLGRSIEGGGKRRIFAICNYVKQILLSPVHDWAFEVLSRIQSDGTFNQEKPLTLLRSRCSEIKDVYSFDLKSATDRWPLSVIYTMFESLFGSTFASSVVNSSLGLNTFLVGPPHLLSTLVIGSRLPFPFRHS